MNVAEETDPVLTIVSTTKTTLTATLAQITAFNLAVAFGGGTVTPGSTGEPVTFKPPPAGEQNFYMLGWAAMDNSEAMIFGASASLTARST